MPSESDEQAQREAQSIDREMKLLERRRGATALETRNAARRLVLVAITTVLVALALWYLMD